MRTVRTRDAGVRVERRTPAVSAPPPGQGPLAMLALAVGLLLMTVQLWLLTLALNLYLAGIREGTIIAAIISGLIFLGGLLVLRLLRHRSVHRS
ncbi:MAG TPA: hypothetical protein VFW98_18940 [Gemmatimonadaceae bacterium]|nr:hypothetical protein [Gemmatimonadaceae bacterium]